MTGSPSFYSFIFSVRWFLPKSDAANTDNPFCQPTIEAECGFSFLVVGIFPLFLFFSFSGVKI